MQDEGHWLSRLVRFLPYIRDPRYSANAFGNSGNVLGFRVVHACDSCSRSRAVTADGLLFHYRSTSVTPLPRLNLVTPPSSISLLLSDASFSPSSSSDDDDKPPEEDLSALGVSGSPMRWLQLPHPQIDFEDGLVGEPAEWLDRGADSWWVEHGFGRKAMSGGGASAASAVYGSRGLIGRGGAIP